MASGFPSASWALAAAVAVATSVPAGAAGFTAGADVVVLVGLPGDVEHENAYEEQLRRLLSLLARAECRPRRTFVLADAPGAVTAPRELAAEVGEASRASVLSLAERLAAAGPRTLFVFGHGGRQASEPVFHVRGPRVTPADLSRLVPAGGPGQAILYFRGSGEFARAMAGKGREILASENAVAFRSDPVGFDIALRLWADRPGVAFTELADLVGRETVASYDERHLARQEEPTLWSNTAPPRAMAREASEAEREEKPGAAAAVASDAWQGIEPVGRGIRADDDAVVLRTRTRIVLGDSPAIRIETDEFVEILTGEGARRADVDLTFSPPAEDLRVLDAEVRLPDGRLERFPAEGVRVAASPADGEYRGPARRTFSLPNAVPGAVLRLHLEREWKRFPLPYVFLDAPIADQDPVRDAELSLRVSARSAFHYAFRNIEASRPEIEETRSGRVFTWRFRDVEPAPDEPLAPPERSPRLLASTFPDWEAFAAWYRGLIREADKITPEIVARAQEVTAGARSDRDKVKALYNEVTRLRYVAVPLGVNSHRPHAAANVLRNRYGDCKDKANLFNTLLAAVGIPADLVLVPRFTQADEAVPGLAFNHAISRVRLPGETIWADTTDDISRFGLLPPGDPGRKVLVVGAGPAALTLLPMPDPADHALRITGRVELGAPLARASFEARATGFADYALRASARGAGAPHATLPILQAGLRLSSGVFAMAEQRHSSVTALEEPFSWTGKGSVLGLLSVVPGSSRSHVTPPFWLPTEWDVALHARRAPLVLNQGYPILLDETIELVLPAGAGEAALPAPREDTSPPLRWSTQWTRQPAGSVQARLQARLASGELGPAESVAFQKQLQALLAAVAEGASLAPS